MLTSNPFALLAILSPLGMMSYIVLMVLAVVIGTLSDVSRKGSAKFFARRRREIQVAATKRLSGMDTFALAVSTVAEAAVSGEFCKWPRRVSHLLMMYGFLFHVISSVLMVFAYPTAAGTPVILPALWTIGAVMVLIGGLWFFFFLRVNVMHDGDSPFHLGQADLFVGSLLASVAFALLWQFAQTTYAGSKAALILFQLYIFFTTLLFVSVHWSKFAHMFFKPAVAFQRRVEEATGSSDLPSPTTENYIGRS